MLKEEKEYLRCGLCNVASPLVKKCKGCHTVGYCSVEHQKDDWRFHKKLCRQTQSQNQGHDPGQGQSQSQGQGQLASNPPFLTEPNDRSINRSSCIATCDIPKGTIILDELPILQFGKIASMYEEQTACVTCGDLLEDRPKLLNSHCHKCDWPMCSPVCQKAPIHSKNECKVFVASNMKNVDKTGTTLLLARCFALRSQNPELWAEILELCPGYHLEVGHMLHSTILENIKKFGKSISPMTSKFPKFLWNDERESLVVNEFVQQVMLISRRVGFERGNEGIIPPCSKGTFLYRQGRHFSESCAPNCMWVIGPVPDFKLRIRAARDIKKGESLTVMREDVIFCGTPQRRLLFLKTVRTPCTCDLCLDPTEFGTYQSAIICPRCREEALSRGIEDFVTNVDKVGWLLPEVSVFELGYDQDEYSGHYVDDPKKYPYAKFWKCDTCGQLEDHIEITIRIHAVLKAMYAGEPGVELQILQEERGNYLHPNHWLVQRAVIGLCHPDAPTFPNIPDSNNVSDSTLGKKGAQQLRQNIRTAFEKMLEYHTHVLRVAEKILPGIQAPRMKICEKVVVGSIHLVAPYFDKENEQEFLELSPARLTHLKDMLKRALKLWREDLQIFLRDALVPKNGPSFLFYSTKDYGLNHLVGQAKMFIVEIDKRLQSFKPKKIEADYSDSGATLEKSGVNSNSESGMSKSGSDVEAESTIVDMGDIRSSDDSSSSSHENNGKGESGSTLTIVSNNQQENAETMVEEQNMETFAQNLLNCLSDIVDQTDFNAFVQNKGQIQGGDLECGQEEYRKILGQMKKLEILNSGKLAKIAPNQGTKTDDPEEVNLGVTQGQGQRLIVSELLTFITYRIKKGDKFLDMVNCCRYFYTPGEILEAGDLLLSLTNETDDDGEETESEIPGNNPLKLLDIKSHLPTQPLDTEEENRLHEPLAHVLLQGIVFRLTQLANSNTPCDFTFVAGDLDKIPPGSQGALSGPSSPEPPDLTFIGADKGQEEEHEEDDCQSVASSASSYSSAPSKSGSSSSQAARGADAQQQLIMGTGPPLTSDANFDPGDEIVNLLISAKSRPAPLARDLDLDLDRDRGIDPISNPNPQPTIIKSKKGIWEFFVVFTGPSIEPSRIQNHLVTRGLTNVQVQKVEKGDKTNAGNLHKSSFHVCFDPPTSFSQQNGGSKVTGKKTRIKVADVYNPSFWPKGCRMVRRWYTPGSGSSTITSTSPPFSTSTKSKRPSLGNQEHLHLEPEQGSRSRSRSSQSSPPQIQSSSIQSRFSKYIADKWRNGDTLVKFVFALLKALLSVSLAFWVFKVYAD